MPVTNKATKRTTNPNKVTKETAELIAKANEVPSIGHNSEKPNAEAVKAADDKLKAALADARKATDKLDRTTMPKIGLAVVEYLKAKAAMQLNNSVKLSVTLSELREHCYDLATYSRRDENGIDTSSASFEQVVRRGIMCGMLAFEEHKSFAIDAKLGVCAPSNALAPKLKVKNPVTHKWQEVDNTETALQSVTVRTIEHEFAEKYGKAKKEDKRATRTAKGGQDQGKGDLDPKAFEEGNVSQRLTMIAQYMHTLLAYPLSAGQLDNVANIARDAQTILDKSDEE